MTVGEPGNSADPATDDGAVSLTYRIGKFEVTNAQYAEFLNAVADSDPNGLYFASMESDAANGGITRLGPSGSHVYEVKPGFEDRPVNYVPFWHALRFANWLHNGQPTGPQGNATTEDGAYTITATGIAGNTITRNPGARFFVPTASPNHANCDSAVGSVLPVGSYPGSPSPLGTFDQGGNVAEWHDQIIGRNRAGRGGDFDDPVTLLARSTAFGASPTLRASWLGFRIASPPPTVTAMGGGGAGRLTLAIVSYGWTRPRRRRPGSEDRAPRRNGRALRRECKGSAQISF